MLNILVPKVIKKPLQNAFEYDIFIVPNQTNVKFIQKKGDYNDSNTKQGLWLLPYIYCKAEH